jgi:predicted acylesterase/phospholipase RssA
MDNKIKLSDIKGISFNTSAWYLFYYMGAIKALLELDPNIGKRVKIYGCSGGAFIALILLFRFNPDDILNEWKRIVKEKNESEWFFDRIYLKKNCVHIYDKFFKDKIDLDDLNKHMNISVTKVSYNFTFPFTHFTNEIISNFESENDLLNTIFKSGYIPCIIGYTPTFDGYCDGGLTNDIYLTEINKKDFLNFGLNTYSTKTKSKEINHCTICFNRKKNFIHFFTPTPEMLDNLFETGYKQTIKYFK